MKITSTIPTMFVSFLAFSLISSAQTLFTDADVNNSYISNPTNWSAGLPTNGVTGTIGTNAQYDAQVSLAGYDIVHTNGTLSKGTGINALTLTDGTTWEMNGPGTQLLGRGINANGSTFTLNQGTANLTENNRDSQITGGAEIIIHGGTMDIGRNFYFIGGDLTVNGGAFSAGSDMGSRNFHSGGNANLNGGTITAKYLTFGSSGFDVNFGGATAGSLTITNFGGGRADVNKIDINFDPGSLMSMQLTDPVESGASGDGDLGWSKTNAVTGLDWAPALWTDGRLTYNEQDYTTLGDWTTVTSTGFGDGSRFNFDVASSTLSLAGGAVDSFAITLNVSDSTLSFLTDSNSWYSVEFTTVLTNGFSPTTNFPGDGFTNTVPVDTSTTNGFYRVKKSSSP